AFRYGGVFPALPPPQHVQLFFRAKARAREARVEDPGVRAGLICDVPDGTQKRIPLRGMRPAVLGTQRADSAEDLGFQRRTGLRAAPTSSKRPTRVECGAVFTKSGCVADSSAIEFIASMKRSHSSLDSDSVGSIIMAPGTMSGNAVV